ncbi:unnamed protein product [Camellia sinensis]
MGKTKKRGLTQKALALASNQSEPRRFHQKREVWRELNLISLNRLIEEGLPDSLSFYGKLLLLLFHSLSLSLSLYEARVSKPPLSRGVD